MFSYLVFALFAILVQGQRFHSRFNFPSFQARETYKLCTYTDETYLKCLVTLEAASNRSEPLPLECYQRPNRTGCISALTTQDVDLVVLTGHGYSEGRRAGLKPVIFAAENDESLYVAVAPRNISPGSIAEAPIIVDQSVHRAFHAALLFNKNRGHDICNFMNNVAETDVVKIVDSAQYQLSDDEILLCPDGSRAEASDFRSCNFEAGLQRAVFVRGNFGSRRVARNIKTRIFDVLLQKFSENSEQPTNGGAAFNFFSTFKGKDDLIFKNDTIAFNLRPFYRNGVTEKVFNQLHCNNEDQVHDPRQLVKRSV